jgi:hypothetical protein
MGTDGMSLGGENVWYKQEIAACPSSNAAYLIFGGINIVKV